MKQCPKCDSELNIDERLSGRCFTCKATFKTENVGNSVKFDKHDKYIGNNIIEENRKVFLISTMAKIIIVMGIIGAIILGYILESFYLFLYVTLGCIFSGIILLGFAEIISLLQDISNKLSEDNYDNR